MNSKPSPFYTPTKWEQRIDSAIALVAPRMALQRAVYRQRRHYFSYMAAKSTEGRKNKTPGDISGETAMGDAERRQLAWNAVDAIENSGLAWSIRTKFVNYVTGQLRYQARTGDKGVNKLYEDYMKFRSKMGPDGLDWTERNSFRQMAGLVVSGMVVKGDVGINVVRADRVYLQGIEGNRIGDPFNWQVRDNYIGGLHLDERGRIAAADIFDISKATGLYRYETTLPAKNNFGWQTFLLVRNPITFDDIRGRTVFKATIDNLHYLKEIRHYELQALTWAASQSGVYHTANGQLPDDLPFDDTTTDLDQYGNVVQRVGVRPNTITALGMGENVSMFQHDRPSPNVLAMYRDTVRDIALGVDLSFGFVWDLSGMAGPAVRHVSAQDKRSIQSWQANIGESYLTPATEWALFDGIRMGAIPYHPRWREHAFVFPPHPTIDAGRESAAALNEYAAAITSGAELAAEAGGDIEEIQAQCVIEAENLITLCKDAAKRLQIDDWREVISMVRSGKAIMQSPIFEAARAAQLQAQATKVESEDPEKKGATSEGSELE